MVSQTGALSAVSGMTGYTPAHLHYAAHRNRMVSNSMVGINFGRETVSVRFIIAKMLPGKLKPQMVAVRLILLGLWGSTLTLLFDRTSWSASTM